jgi:citrate synthase
VALWQAVNEYVSAREASSLLGVKLRTLYAYVSRGLIRSLPGESNKAKRYRRTDVMQLKTRALARSGHGPVAAGALRFGEPVLETSITEISADGPRYRGISSVELAREAVPFERVAELLWTGKMPTESPEWPRQTAAFSTPALAKLAPAGTPPLQLFGLMVAAEGAADPERFAAPPERELRRARGLIGLLASFGLPKARGTIAESLAGSFGKRLRDKEARP